jgi:hypothetical protein
MELRDGTQISSAGVKAVASAAIHDEAINFRWMLRHWGENIIGGCVAAIPRHWAHRKAALDGACLPSNPDRAKT